MARVKRKGTKTATSERVRAQRGYDRAAHFESGGSVEEWRGYHAVHDSVSRSSRTRSASRRRAIRESADE